MSGPHGQESGDTARTESRRMLASFLGKSFGGFFAGRRSALRAWVYGGIAAFLFTLAGVVHNVRNSPPFATILLVGFGILLSALCARQAIVNRGGTDRVANLVFCTMAVLAVSYTLWAFRLEYPPGPDPNVPRFTLGLQIGDDAAARVTLTNVLFKSASERVLFPVARIKTCLAIPFHDEGEKLDLRVCVRNSSEIPADGIEIIASFTKGIARPWTDRWTESESDALMFSNSLPSGETTWERMDNFTFFLPEILHPKDEIKIPGINLLTSTNMPTPCFIGLNLRSKQSPPTAAGCEVAFAQFRNGSPMAPFFAPAYTSNGRHYVDLPANYFQYWVRGQNSK